MTLTYKGYCNLMNRIAYYMLKNNKPCKKRNKYISGKNVKTFNEVKKLILNDKGKSALLWGRRFTESVYVDNGASVLPAHVTGGYGKVHNKELYTNYIKYVIAYVKTHKKVPQTIPTTYSKKYGHATKSGCENRGQNNGYYCGDHSLQEVFRNLTGIVVPQGKIAEWAGTTTSGTDHDGLNFAVETFNRKHSKNLTVKWYNFNDLGWNGIKSIINSTNKDCVIHNLYRNQWGHYEVINKVYDDYCDVQNSLGDYCDLGCYCGYVEERTFSTFRSYISGISQKSVMVITNE